MNSKWILFLCMVALVIANSVIFRKNLDFIVLLIASVAAVPILVGLIAKRCIARFIPSASVVVGLVVFIVPSAVAMAYYLYGFLVWEKIDDLGLLLFAETGGCVVVFLAHFFVRWKKTASDLRAQKH